MKKRLIIVILFLGAISFVFNISFTNQIFAAEAAAPAGAKAAGAKAGTATTAGVSAGTIAAITVAAAAIAAIAVAAGGEGGAAVITPAPAPTPSETVENFMKTVDEDTEQAASLLVQTLDESKVSLLAEAIDQMTWDQWQEFTQALAQVQDVSELQGLTAIDALKTFLDNIKSTNPDLYSILVEFLKSLTSNDQLNRTVALVQSIESEDEFNATKTFMAQVKENYQETVETYLTQLHPGYEVTFTTKHIGGGEYVTVVHLTAIHH